MTAFKKILAFIIGLALPAIVFVSCSDNSAGPTPDKSLAGQLEYLNRKYDIPGAAGIVFSHDGISDLQVSGVRRAGYPDSLEPADLMHIGSLTKWMTSTMIATLVEEHLLEWTTKPADVIPNLVDSVDPGYADITLLDLLRHRAGIPADDDFDSIPTLTGTLRQQRLQAAQMVLKSPPAVTPGNYRYSNVGYVIAACMAESVTDQDWRTLMDTRLFEPLDIDAFFGWPTEHDPSQPWGHVLSGGQFTPVEPSIEPPEIDFLEPAGFVSMNLEDYSKFIRLHLQAMQGDPHLLDASTFSVLNTPVDDYACGVGVFPSEYGTLYWHNGSNTFFYMVTYVIPDKDFSIVIGVNVGDDSIMTPVGRAAETVLTTLLE